MKHAREDYNRIQDPAGLIPENEPVFLLRAQDKHAPEVVAFWASLVHREGGDGEIANMAMRQSRAMKDWQHGHGKKSPDLPDETEPQPVKQARACNYPECNCPLDAGPEPDWCARGLPHEGAKP